MRFRGRVTPPEILRLENGLKPFRPSSGNGFQRLSEVLYQVFGVFNAAG